MATKRPICNYSGVLEELRAEDVLPVQFIKFYKADGSQDNIDLTVGGLKFFKADGSQDDIAIG